MRMSVEPYLFFVINEINRIKLIANNKKNK